MTTTTPPALTMDDLLREAANEILKLRAENQWLKDRLGATRTLLRELQRQLDPECR